MTAYIGYDNIIDQNAPELISEPISETAENPFANAYDGNLFDTWMPGANGNATAYFRFTSSLTADYIAIYGHNLAGKLVELQRRGAFSWSSVHTFTPTSNSAVFERFTSTTDDRWRIIIYSATVDTYVTLIHVGQALALNPLRAPFSPPPKADNVEIINNESVENIPLGRVTRKLPFDIQIDQTIVDPSWIEANTGDLINSVNKKPFFFTWDDAKDDACVCWTDRPVASPRYNSLLHQSFSIRAKGLR